jgi:AcrR family transcriptional regulator
MARPRKVSDEELTAACGRVIGRFGPGFTLAQVAAEAGVAVGTVAGRFGSKRNLLLAMMTAGADGMALWLRETAAGLAPLDAIRRTMLASGEDVADPATTSNHLGQLGVDLADPELRAGFARMRAGVREVLTELFTAADLPGAPPPAQAARIIAAMAHGVLMDWALDPSGEFADVLRADLDAILNAWR